MLVFVCLCAGVWVNCVCLCVRERGREEGGEGRDGERASHRGREGDRHKLRGKERERERDSLPHTQSFIHQHNTHLIFLYYILYIYIYIKLHCIYIFS